VGWFTTQKNETMAGKAKRVTKEKFDDAKSAATPSNIRANRHAAKGGNLCIGCSKPVRGGNVHKKCAGKVASNYTSLMAKELAQQKQQARVNQAKAARDADRAKREQRAAQIAARKAAAKARTQKNQPEPKKKTGGWW
jgi:hypothetical protein